MSSQFLTNLYAIHDKNAWAGVGCWGSRKS